MARDIVQIRVQPPEDPDSFQFVPLSNVVEEVLQEVFTSSGALQYRIKFEDDHQDVLLFDDILNLDGGPEALEIYEEGGEEEVRPSSDEGRDSIQPRTRRSSRHSSSSVPKKRKVTIINDSDDQLNGDGRRRSSRSETARQTRGGAQRSLRSNGKQSRFFQLRLSSDEQSASDDSDNKASRKSRRQRELRKRARLQETTYDNGASGQSSSESEIDLLTSDVLPKKRRKKYRSSMGRSSRLQEEVGGIKFEKTQKAGTRASQRSTRAVKNMEEADINDIYRDDSDREKRPAAPKVTVTREKFQPISRSHPFAIRHMQQCDTCGNRAGPQGPLIYCQGCSLAYHKPCLGYRTGRDHLVTKIGEDEFVLQCRRCVNVSRRKDSTAPDQSMCQSCRDTGPACAPFRSRKTAQQEEKEREENDGVDPAVLVRPSLINGSENVLFRCVQCWRAFHFHHLISRTDAMDMGLDDETIATERLREYGSDWTCRECAEAPAKVAGLIAWRPVDLEYMELDTSEVSEDSKEYLIKWEKKSYFRALWMPGAWTWGITAPAMRKAFGKRDNGEKLPVATTEDAIPEDYLRIDIIFDVKFTSIVDTRAEEVDKARIREVDRCLVKYKGLSYEDVVWETVPTPDDGDRWTDFVKAYDDWVVGRYVKQPKGAALKLRLEKARSLDFNKLEKKEQPKGLVGGELMKYQLEGLNWLYYRWFIQKNGILADEMGLGKTIQIIGLLATLVEDHACFPFLIVVPNSTCPNWRREIKTWAPSLKIVTYFGTAGARRLAYEHELFPEGSKTLKAHIVVTSYEAASDDSVRRFLRGVPWQGLIVDEGQRLKNDKANLYGALKELKVPFTLLLTGTPLQNNARELFNLLQFLDNEFNAQELELEYQELTKENIPQLHDLIRPFFLRRTKAEVLTFLPPMGQVIIPVSMSVLQRKLYQSILAKNGQLIRAIFNNEKAVAKSERANLVNILMQLRKCLCHPFVYSQDIEERTSDQEVSHRNLVEASAKLQLLALLLPKLKERGHRVLMFSQFLDMLDIAEDFLNGLGMQFQRLDGSMSSLEKQKRIDQFNAPNSELFAFLLSTRAGGVGINLATADTVIIMDPDWNPHQDIQALSRAHRIGQKKKVLCFQIMTRASAEEKIVQIGRRKMALDHVLIEQMDADEESGVDMESILRHGAAEILEGDASNDIKYDEKAIEKLLDRSQIEDTKAGEDHSAESQFSFARVWANDNESLADSINGDSDEERAPDAGVWEKILQERERLAAEEAARRQQNLGRGKRNRQTIDYTSGGTERGEKTGDTPKKPGRGMKEDSDSDTDFQAGEESEAEKSADEEEDHDAEAAAREVAAERSLLDKEAPTVPPPTARIPLPPPPPAKSQPARQARNFRRSNIEWPADPSELPSLASEHHKAHPPPVVHCVGCNTHHRQGYCPLKIAGAEICNLCGLAHFGIARTCPHIRSETQVRAMLHALKQSNEPREHVHEATKYLSGVKGTLAQAKRIKAARAENEAARRRSALTGMGPANGQVPNVAPFGQLSSAHPQAHGYYGMGGHRSFPHNAPRPMSREEAEAAMMRAHSSGPWNT